MQITTGRIFENEVGTVTEAKGGDEAGDSGMGEGVEDGDFARDGSGVVECFYFFGAYYLVRGFVKVLRVNVVCVQR